MKEKQSRSIKLDNPFVYILVALIIISIAFIFISPRISSYIFPFKRTAELNSFVNQAKSENHIDPRKFWEFRDLYSNGYFKFSNKGLDKSEATEALEELNINPQNVDIYFSKFDSRNLESIDGLTKKNTVDDLFSEKDLNIKKILFKNSNSIIFKNAQDQTYIIFILPVSEMKKANGFFNYADDKNILSGKNWIDITRIRN